MTEESGIFNQDRFRVFFEHNKDAMFVADPQTHKLIDCNLAAEKLTGRSRQEILKMRADDLHPPEHRDATMEIFKRQVAGEEVTGESVVLSRTGQRIPVSINGAMVEINGRSLALGTFRDITELKRNEEILRNSKIQFEELFNNISSGVAIYKAKDNGEDFVIVNINKSGERLSQVKHEEVTGKSVLEVFPGVKAMGLFTVFQQVWKSGQPQHQATSLYQDQHLTEWVENYVYKLPSGEIIAVYEDVTERKAMEENLKQSKDYLNNIINTIADPIFVKDSQHRFVLVNDAECALTGHPRQKVIGKTDYDFFPKEQVDIFWAKDEELLESGQENINEEEITNAAGEKKVIVTKKTLYTDRLGNKFIVGIIRDITERKKMENFLRSSENLLNEVGNIAKIGGWEMDLATGKANWTKGTYDIVEIGYDQPIPGLHDHVDYYLPEYRQMIREKMENLITTKQPMSFEAQAKTAKGNIRWFRALGEVVEEGGRAVKLMGTLQDITELKQLEEKTQKQLHELEVFYKASLNREERILELKKEVEALKKELGK